MTMNGAISSSANSVLIFLQGAAVVRSDPEIISSFQDLSARVPTGPLEIFRIYRWHLASLHGPSIWNTTCSVGQDCLVSIWKHHLFCGPRLFGFNLKTPLVLWAKIVWLPLPQCLAWTRTKASEKLPEFRTGIFTCQEPSQEKPGLLPKTFNYGSYLKGIFSSRDPCVKVGKSGGLW